MQRACSHILGLTLADLAFSFYWPTGRFIVTISWSHQKSDLDDIVIYLTEALLLPFRTVDGPSDLEYGARPFRHLLCLPLRNAGIRISTISVELTNALNYKTEIHLDSEQENTDEVFPLYLSCLPWDPLEEHTASILGRLVLAVAARFSKTGQSELFEEVAGYLREVCESGTPIDFQETLFNGNILFYLLDTYLRPVAGSRCPDGNSHSQSIGGEKVINICRATLLAAPSNLYV
ncbi:hypothetical protein BC826DRAFT_237068 [Russula brevipes]|nr:hypothetical protein BC826DRAFT_237068 [Russula brevipes]